MDGPFELNKFSNLCLDEEAGGGGGIARVGVSQMRLRAA